jgi:hypothetical protein
VLKYIPLIFFLKKKKKKLDKAAGWLFLIVEQEQRVHFQGIQDSPVKMWEALEAVHRQKKAGMRFNAYDELFSIRKLEEESLQSLINCVETAKCSIKELRPSTFTLDMLDDKLASMALIRSLPEEYSGFTSSLLLMDKLGKTTVHQAFVTEDLQRRKGVQDASGGSQALAARFGFKNKSKTCDFCRRDNHTVDVCKTFENARKQAQDNAQKPKTYPPKANKAQEASESATGSSSTSSTKKAQRVVEFAGNASAPLSSSSPSPSTPLQLDSDFNWLADTGATSHMTPHRHWFKSYAPHKIPIRLANNSVVYSAGIGSVVFQSVVNGKEARGIKLTRVLHVPDLRSNLLSCLYLAQHKGFNITISAHAITFKQGGRTLFMATIHSNNSAELDGTTATSETAYSVSTLPLDLNLWH